MKWQGRWLHRLSQWPARAVWTLVAAWAAVVFYASSRAGHELPVFAFAHMDKVLHFGVFAVGGALVTWAFCRWPMRLRWAVLLGILLVSLYGAADEWHQLYTPGRSGADVYDWLADFAGALTGALLAPPILYQGYVRTLTPRSRRTNPTPLPGN